MNICIISATASFHHLAQLLVAQGNSKIVHIGAAPSVKESADYIPVSRVISFDSGLDNDTIEVILEVLRSQRFDYVLADKFSVTNNEKIIRELKDLQIPYFFVDPNISFLETERMRTKDLLNSLSIPTPSAKVTTARELYQNFKTIPRPFVIKISQFLHGRQTVVIDDSNFEQVFDELFSIHNGCEPHYKNIGLDVEVVIEEFLKIKKEYSYIALFNKSSWEFLGAARDYKKELAGDRGENTIGMGAYSLADVDDVVHDYIDRIYFKIQKYLLKKQQWYKGFIFLNIAIGYDNIPYVLEINTRPGDPEVNVILETVSNDLADLFFAASTDSVIPTVNRTGYSVSARIVSKQKNWNTISYLRPKFTTPPDNIKISFQNTETNLHYHSLVTATSKSKEMASEILHEFLSGQDLREYVYRKDIGMLD